VDPQNEDLRVLSVIHFVISWLAAIFGCIPPVFVVLVSWVRKDFEQIRAAPEVFNHTQMVLGLLLGAALWTYAFSLNRAGHFIVQRRHRAFILAVNVGSLLFLPFGTVVGLLTFATMAKPEVKSLFAAPESHASVK
jgi:hypothetical protein